MSSVFLELTDGQLAILADEVAKRLAKKPGNDRPLTVAEFAAELGLGRDAIYHRIESGEIRCVPGMRKKLIPRIELNRLLNPDNGGHGK